jgi:hypothetical protein
MVAISQTLNTPVLYWRKWLIKQIYLI